MTHLKEWRWTVLGMICIAAFSANVLAQKSLGAASGPSKKNIAVINLKNGAGVTPAECELISDRLRGDLFNTEKVNVMEREQMQEILKEQGFQVSGACTDEACLVQMGQLLGVEMLVTGSLGKVGSMFLVNVRMIDVKTAKIVKVVSVDVKGDIEDVVGRLKNIADQLVGAQAQTTSLNEAPPEERKREEPKVREPKEEKKVIEQPKEEKRTIEIPEDERARLNKNKSGIRVCLNTFFGGYHDEERSLYYDHLGYNTGGDTLGLDTLTGLKTVSSTPFVNPEIIFSIKAGPVLIIDLGFGFGTKSVKYERNLNYGDTIATKTWDDQLTVISFLTGINFVKRWYPFKLNIGIIFDANYLNLAENYVYKDNYYYYYIPYDTTWYYDGFNVSYGFRVGGEYLMGNHFGISADILLCRSYFETLTRKEDNYDNNNYYIGYTEYSRAINLPIFGLGIGFNFYY